MKTFFADTVKLIGKQYSDYLDTYVKRQMWLRNISKEELKENYELVIKKHRISTTSTGITQSIDCELKRKDLNE